MRSALVLPFLAFATLASAAPQDRAIRKEVVVPAPVADVWKAWTTNEGMRSWLVPDSKIDLRPSGPYEVYFVAGGRIGERGSEGCQVLSYLPERMLSFSWNAPPPMVEARKRRTFVVLEFIPQGKETKLVLTNGGYGTDKVADESFAYFDRAWDMVLQGCRKRFVDGPAQWPKSDPPKPAPKKNHFAIFLQPVRAKFVETMTKEEGEAIGRHFARLKQLTEAGMVVMAGPTDSEPPRGLVIVEAATIEEARKVLDEDPAVKAGVFKGEIFPFNLALLRGMRG